MTTPTVETYVLTNLLLSTHNPSMTRTPIKAKRNRVDMERVGSLYTVQHLTTRQIGALMGVSHAAIYKALLRLGISSDQGERVDVTCFVCGASFSKARSQWRNKLRHYCTEACYGKSMENPAYNPSRTGQRMARNVVRRYYDLLPSQVVHHHDSNCNHNDVSNLAIFATQAEHMSYERGGYAKPIWDGRNVRRIE